MFHYFGKRGKMKEISDLKHAKVKLKSGGEIIVLNTGAVIDAEAEAMLQALHSRSTGGLMSHLEVLAVKGPANFMKNFYVGYGHKSIGDCGTGTIFIEGVSMLAAKAIQDNQLYSGQESSTRYIDFSKQLLIDPTKSSAGKEVLEMQRQFYMSAQELARKELEAKYQKKYDEDGKIYQKVINARAFDITRSLFPAGASTNLAWHTNLRQAADKLLFLRHHPLQEVREISEGIETGLRERFQNSFGHKRYESTEEYQDLIADNYLYHNPESPLKPIVDFGKIDRKEIERHRELFDKRPEWTELPKYLGQAGILDVQFQLDFGSFRDIQRHRAIIQRMPLLTSELGFNQWYIENLPEKIREKLPQHLDDINNKINSFEISKEEAQYFLPMGYNISNRFTGDLPATIYMVERRARNDVHPTLQYVAHDIGNQIKENLGIPIYMDKEPSRFDIKRGKQDIVLK